MRRSRSAAGRLPTVRRASATGHVRTTPFRSILRCSRDARHRAWTALGAGVRLHEREAALESACAGLGEVARRTGGLVVVLGPAGIGKTRLAAEIARRAAVRGLAVLAARGHEFEQDLPFGVLLQLLEPALTALRPAERTELFAGPAGAARPVFDAAQQGPPSDPAVVVHALYRLTLRLSARTPLVLLIDDAHWADAPTLRWLHFLARRSSDAAVLSVVLSRTQEPTAAQPMVDVLASVQSARTLMLEPLTRAAVVALLHEALGPRPDELIEACHASTAGNPFLLTELIRHIAQDAARSDASGAGRPTRIVPATISRWVLQRVYRLGPDTLAAVRAAAVLGDRARLDQLAALAGLATDDAAAACDRARAAGILDPGDTLAFIHPLVADAIRRNIPASARGLMHRQAAGQLARGGAPASQIASHLLAAPSVGEGWTVARLREAARRALACGAPETAAEYLRRAAAEPPATRLRGQVHYEWGIAASRLDPSSALPRFRLALDQAAGQRSRCAAALALAKNLAHCDRVGAAVGVLDKTATSTDDPACTRQLRIEQAMWSAWWAGHADPAARRALLESLAHRARGQIARAITVLGAWEAMIGGDPAHLVGALADGALAPDTGWGGEGFDFEIPCILAQAYIFTDRLDEASALLDRGLAHLGRHGWRGTHYSFVQTLRATAAYRRGDLPAAEHDARAAWHLVAELGPRVPSWWWSLATLVQVLTARGHLADAADLAARTGLGEHSRDALLLPDPRTVRGELRLAQTRTAEGAADLAAAGLILEAHGCTNPSWNPWRMNLALARRSTDPASAHALAADTLERARRANTPWALGRALRTLALLTPGPKNIELFEHSAHVLERSPARYEHARTLVAWGAALRRANHRADARAPLRAGLDLAHQCGAEKLVEHARSELAASGARAPRSRLTGPQALTPSETRVAALAATGLNNPRIAETLHISRKTVEKHLAGAYTKLGIVSRHDLPRALT